MLNEQEITRQLNRLMRLPFAPADDDDVKALMAEFKRIIERDCRSIAHLTAVVDYLVDTPRPENNGESRARVPAPADLVSAFRGVTAPELTERPQVDNNCPECYGSGYCSVERVVDSGPFLRSPQRFAEFCDCAAGQWKRRVRRQAADEQRAKRDAKGAA